MKKIRVIVLTLIVVVAMMGAGYAAWSTKITYNNTMKTAEWNVFVENDAASSLGTNDTVQTFNKGYKNIKDNKEGYQSEMYGKFDTVDSNDLSGAMKGNTSNFVYTIKPTITTDVENKDTVNFAFYNMHPGTKVGTTFEIRNFGSIPARIADVRVILNDDNEIKGELLDLVNAIVVNGEFFDHTGSGLKEKTKSLGKLKNVSLWNLESEIEKILINEYILKEEHNVNLKRQTGAELESGTNNGLEFSIPVYALKAAGKNVATLEQLKVKIEFDFVQYNQNVTDID